MIQPWSNSVNYSERFYLLYCNLGLVCCFTFHLIDDDYRLTDDKREGEEGVKKKKKKKEKRRKQKTV